MKKLLKDRQTEIEESNKELDEGVFAATADPKKTSVPPARKPAPPYLNFAPLENADAALTLSAARFTKALAAVETTGDLKVDAKTLAEINALLMQSDRKLIREAGLPGRPWYKNQIYAPGALIPATGSRRCRECGKRWTRMTGSRRKSRFRLLPR